MLLATARQPLFGMPMVAEIFYRNLKSGAIAPAMLEELNQAMCDRLPAMLYMAFGFVEISPELDRTNLERRLAWMRANIATNEITDYASFSTALGTRTDLRSTKPVITPWHARPVRACAWLRMVSPSSKTPLARN